MDSQQAAFEKFKAAGSGNKFARESRHAGGMQKEFDGPVPDLYSIHNGSVVRIEDYGAFVQIPGFKKHGLVYKSQASNHFTQSISDVVTVGDHVWVKVTSVQDGKVALSMKYVSQGDGTDLDPNLVKLTGDEDRKRSHTGFMDKAPISIEEGGVLLKTVCKKCGAAGHLAAECFSGGGQFELLPEDDQDDNMAQVSRSGRSGDKEKKKKRDKDDRRDKDRVHGRDRDRHKESRHDHRENRNDHRENRHDHKERKDASSHHRDKRHNRSRSPKRRAEEPHGSNVESLEEALAVMRAHKHRKRSRHDISDVSVADERKGRGRSSYRGVSRSKSRSRSPTRRHDDRHDRGHGDSYNDDRRYSDKNSRGDSHRGSSHGR